MKNLRKALLLAVGAWSLSALAAEPYMNVTVGGVLTPGVYGRIDIGNAPPPPVIYAQPVWVQRPQVVAPVQPLYLYVPPGHAKKWAKHCHQYNACGQPVYFVKMNGKSQKHKPHKHDH